MKKIFLFLIFSLFCFLSNAAENKIFWDNEVSLVSGNIGKIDIFGHNSVLGILFSEDGESKKLYLKYSEDGNIWKEKRVLLDDFYSNNSSGVDFSAVSDENNDLYLFYRTKLNSLELVKFTYQSGYKDQKKLQVFDSQNIVYLPEIFFDSNKDIHLFYSENTDKDVKLIHKKISIADNKITENFVGGNLRNSVNPSIVENNGTIYVAFQAKDSKIQEGLYYNILLATSKDFGESWDYKNLVISKGENNQRPNIFINESILYLVWEKEDENFISHIFYKSFNIENWKENPDVAVSTKTSEAHNPYFLQYNNFINIFWYDNKNGSFQIYTCFLVNNVLSDVAPFKIKNGRTIFTYPFLYKERPCFIWIQEDKENIIYYQKSITDVYPPQVTVRNIKEVEGVKLINRENISIEWTPFVNISGIKGFRTLLTKEENDRINESDKMLSALTNSLDYKKLTDGTWFFKIRAYDNAGNVSKDGVYKFDIDTIPPEAPVFVDIELDDNGNLKTNSPVIKWDDPTGKCYIYKFSYRLFGKNEEESKIEEAKKVNQLENYSMYTEKSVKFTEEFDNGSILLGLQGIDRAGNVSEINWAVYKLANYKPQTIIAKVDMEIKESGEKLLAIYGRGFSTDGVVTKIIIDKDQKAPYDYVIEANDINILSDKLIKQRREITVEDGTYYIGLEHSVRGIKFDNSRSIFSAKWAFKYEKVTYFNFESIKYIFGEIDLTKWILIFVGIFWLLIVILILRSLVNIGRERAYVNGILEKLDKVRVEMNDKDFYLRRIEVVKKGIGLTIKYTLLILSIVVAIVVATSLSISYLALENEKKNLSFEMNDKALILTRNYEAGLVDIYTLEKGFSDAVDQTALTSSFQDINFVLFKSDVDNTTIIRYNDKIDLVINNVTLKKLPDEERNKLINKLVFSDETKRDIEKFKTNYDGNAKIYPDFSSKNLKKYYTFMKPVIIKKDGGKKYIGEIAIGFSFDRILKTIRDETFNLLRIAAMVTAIAILISIIGAIFLATTTIRPIKNMSKHVAIITSKEDYEELVAEGNDTIKVKTTDEIGILGNSINEMTHKLIEKAKADKQLLLGKEIQKKFITLEPVENDYIDVYGFYEGAKGVSGDYFEYRKISDDYYAFIICDVSGKAVPAALIMVQISTIFHSYFANFKIGRDKLDTVEIINRINDTIEERGFQGRFAAILVIIFNIKTGLAILTNAGYTQLLVYRESIGKCESIKLASSGAAGVFPSYMLPDPFELEKVNIDHGDIIFLFTDGIEEARNGKKTVDEKGDEVFDEFGNEHVQEVINNSKIKTPKAIINNLVHAEKQFRGEVEQYDDLTILGIKRK
jgi:serine phosphatase RsbU (regulator of sigma subunit)